MKLFKYGLPIVALALLASCSDDKFDGPKEETADALYLSLQINALQTRTATGDANEEKTGEEVGLEKENKISSAYVVLVKNDNTVAAVGDLTTISRIGQTDKYSASGAVDRDAVSGLANQPLQLFVICNYYGVTKPVKDQPIQQVLDAATVAATAEVYGDFVGVYTADNNFLMTNADTDNMSVTLTDADLAPGAHLEDNPFQMGPIKVQRAVARFDIYSEEEDQEFTVKTVGDEEPVGITVTLTGAALVNVSKSFNLFKTLSDADLLETTPVWKYFASEWDSTAEDYDFTRIVQDPKSAAKVGLIDDQSDVEDLYFANVFDTDGTQNDPMSFAYSTITGLTNSGQTPTGVTLNDWAKYGIFDYCSANTIHKKGDQKKVLTTGVIFKAQMTGGAFDEADGDPVYVYNNRVYGTFDDLKDYYEEENAKSSPKADFLYLKKAIEEAIDKYNEDEGNTEEEDLVDFTDDEITEAVFKSYLVEKNFTVYEAEGEDGEKNYNCYYYYWNRHNDNGANGEMGYMEFGVVRNNIYKLKVTDINQLGHPSKTEDDPTPNKPDDPDEDNDFYMSVEVQVIPWVVRVNNIEF